MNAGLSLINLTLIYFNEKTLTWGVCDNWWKSQKSGIVSWLPYGISITLPPWALKLTPMPESRRVAFDKLLAAALSWALKGLTPQLATRAVWATTTGSSVTISRTDFFSPVELFFHTDIFSDGSAVGPCQQSHCQPLSGGRQMHRASRLLPWLRRQSHCLTELRSQEAAASATPPELS